MNAFPVVLAAGPFDFLKPVGDALYALRIPFEKVFEPLYNGLNSVGPIRAIGSYGVAVIILTLVIKALLFPVFQTQLKLTKKTQAEQKKVAPQLAELRKKYKKDPAKLNTEMMALYKEHGINPLSSAAGCLPMLVQMPILIGLYRAFADKPFYEHLIGPHNTAHFLWVSDISKSASIQHPVTWLLPALAGATTFVQSKMFTPPVDPNADPSAAQAAQIGQSMSLLMPFMIMFFAFQPLVAQALVIYWIVSNLFSIGQQYFVNGWGQLPILGNKTLPPPPPTGRDRDSSDGPRMSKVLATQPQASTRRNRRR